MTMRDIVINGLFRIDRKIGEGGFGLIYSGTNVKSGEEVAIKLEHIRDAQGELSHEADIYKALSGRTGFPEVRWFGQVYDFSVMVYDLLGPSLEDLFHYCDRKFSLKTIILLVDQLIYRMYHIHSKSFLHRDIKPENFLMGSGRNGNMVYTIDFGLAQKFTPELAEDNTEPKLRLLGGTVNYASLRNHRKLQQSWGDDMESLGYMLVYFARGSLPWEGLKAGTTEELNEKIGRMKERMSGEEICRGLPVEFARYINHMRSLGFGKKPDYSGVRQQFRRLFARMGFQYNSVFDWTERLYGKPWKVCQKALKLKLSV
ncbi:casein kinase I isoform delta [Diaporthe sp. PMI_573]|nr:casein kinase I isoform delta [Diaporthaceae sp. PMI_573]